MSFFFCKISPRHPSVLLLLYAVTWVTIKVQIPFWNSFAVCFTVLFKCGQGRKESVERKCCVDIFDIIYSQFLLTWPLVRRSKTMSTFRSNHKNIMIWFGVPHAHISSALFIVLWHLLTFLSIVVLVDNLSGQKIDMVVNKATQTKTETVLYIQLPHNCNRDTRVILCLIKPHMKSCMWVNSGPKKNKKSWESGWMRECEKGRRRLTVYWRLIIAAFYRGFLLRMGPPPPMSFLPVHLSGNR